ncbi:MAG: pseudouridine synthase, partial [Gammaproteobacteria bacterium]
WPKRPLQMVDHQRGKSALTRWTVLDRDSSTRTSRMDLNPLTGRTHQLRVHMAAMGHPILGCPFYAPAPVLEAAPRLLLHARSLSLRQADGNTLQLNVPAPF